MIVLFAVQLRSYQSHCYRKRINFWLIRIEVSQCCGLKIGRKKIILLHSFSEVHQEECLRKNTLAFVLPKVVPASGLETDETMTKPKPSFSPRRISTSYGWIALGTTLLLPPPPPPPPLPIPLVEPEPELTVFREFWLP